MRTSALFGAKNFDLSRFMVYLHGQGGEGGVESVRTFFGKGHFSEKGEDVRGQEKVVIVAAK